MKKVKKTKKVKPEKKTARIVLTVIFVLLVIALAGVFGFAYKCFQDNIKPVNSATSESVYFAIEPGDTIKSVAKRLAEQNLIKNTGVFELAARIGNKSNIQVGLYQIGPNLTAIEILNILSDPKKAIVENAVTVVLQEGWWAKDMARAIAEKCDISAPALLALWNDIEFIQELGDRYWFIDENSMIPGARVMLEGYLYPDTYYFYRDADAKTITYKILDNFNDKVLPYKTQIETGNMSLQQLLTLASLVQSETGNYQDMALVAGVFINRLDGNMKLQSSVTVCYTLYDYKNRQECELSKNQNIESPYNTYQITGLPLGPICNPSVLAIDAVLNYTKSDYWYFIGKDGVTYFAKTYEEHLINIDKYLR